MIVAAMREYRAEFHVHTVLSPCAGVEMIPPLIVEQALECGIDLIAITDHNASANVAAVQKAAETTPLVVIPGMEVQTREDIHVVCLFPDLASLGAWQMIIDQALPDMKNDPEHLGEQFVVDETGLFLRSEPRLLLASARISLEDTIQHVTRLGGLAIPAHVDRMANSLLAILGFIPPDLPLDAIEISSRTSPQAARARFPQLSAYTLLQGGDVHYLNDFLGANCLRMEALSFTELCLAIRGQSGRSVTICTKKT